MPDIPEMNDELKKLMSIATDMELAPKIRSESITTIGNIRTHEALLALLALVGNDRLNIDDRENALKKAREVLKSNR
jgi:hypothetical protein